MTVTDPAVHVHHTAAKTPHYLDVDDTQAHLLRLCLDLQLDALLLTLGSAAQNPANLTPSTWRRWLDEDVDAAYALATDTMNGGAALPATLGPDCDSATSVTVIDHLTSRYDSMRRLLTDLLERSSPSREGSAWHPRLYEALEHCQTRLHELDRHRQAVTPCQTANVGQHKYLPGELLG